MLYIFDKTIGLINREKEIDKMKAAIIDTKKSTDTEDNGFYWDIKVTPNPDLYDGSKSTRGYAVVKFTDKPKTNKLS